MWCGCGGALLRLQCDYGIAEVILSPRRGCASTNICIRVFSPMFPPLLNSLLIVK